MRAQTRLHRLALCQRDVALRVFATLAGVRLAADAVHGDGKRGVCFGRNGAERHCAGGEAFDDLFRGFNLFQRHGRALFEFEVKQSAQSFQFAGLIVDQCGVFFVCSGVVRASCMLQLGDDLGRPHVLFATRTHGVFAACVEHFGKHGVIAECELMQPHLLFGDFENADALDAGASAREILVEEGGVQANGLENLCAAIALVRRDAHFGHYFIQALADRFDETLFAFVRRNLRHDIGELRERFQR